MRAELLSANWFLSVADARAKCEAWRRDYNELRPHGSLGQKTPMEQAQALSGTPRRRAKRPPKSRFGWSKDGVQTNTGTVKRASSTT